MLRFSLFGFPIAVHWMFWVNTALLGGGLSASGPTALQKLLIWVIAVFVSIVIHELGHAFLMRGFGARASIVLYAFGGLAIPNRGFPRGRSVLVSLAGPIVQLAFGFAATLLFANSRGDAWFIREFYADFIYVSIWWALFNLLPVYPLDGGHVMLHGLGPRFFKLTMVVSILIAVLVGLYRFEKYGSWFSLVFFGMLAWSNLQRLRGDQPSPFLRPD